MRRIMQRSHGQTEIRAMSMINVQQLLETKYPAFLTKPVLITRPNVAVLKKLLGERELSRW